MEKVHVNKNLTATLKCPACYQQKTVDVALYQKKGHTVTIRCPCKKTFQVILDFRKFYRKKTQLPASFASRNSSNSRPQGCLISDISLTGVALKYYHRGQFKIDDELQVNFTLDGKQSVDVTRAVRIRNTSRKDHLGCEFFPVEPDKTTRAIGFFLQ